MNTHPNAVYNLECKYDGEIPAHEMAEARATDAAFLAANPFYKAPLISKLDEERMMVSYYKAKTQELIAAKRAMDMAGLVNRAWSFGMVLSNFDAWRRCRRNLAALELAVA